MTPTARSLCPLCDWHHDHRALPTLTGLSGNSIEDIIRAGIERQNQTDETAVREHLETHPLIEWVAEVARLQKELNAAVAVRGPATADDFPWWNRPGVLPAEELHLPPGPRLTGMVMDPNDVIEVDGVESLRTPATTVGQCGYVRERWDGPYRMQDGCTAAPGHTREHGPWVMEPSKPDAPAAVAGPAAGSEVQR